MFKHISLWKLNTDGKDADRKDDPCQFEGDLVPSVGISPSSWVEDSGAIWTCESERDEWDVNKGRYFGLADHNSEEERPDSFSNVELRKS